MARMPDKQKKQDKFINAIYSIIDFAVKRRETALTIGIVIVVVIIAAFWTFNYFKGQKIYSKELLGYSQFALRHDEINAAVDSLHKLVSKFPDDQNGTTGYYLLGRVYFLLGRYDSSIIFYEGFLNKESKDKEMVAAAHGALASCAEELGRYDEAATQYLEVVDNYPNYFNNARYLISAAQCYEYAGNFQGAIEVYKRYLDNYDDSDAKGTVVMELARLKQMTGVS